MSKKKNTRYSKILIAFLVLSTFVFTGVMIVVYCREGDIPDSLVYAFFGFITGELGWLAGIKKQEAKISPEKFAREEDPESYV